MHAYNECLRVPGHQAKDWCWRNVLSPTTLEMIRDMPVTDVSLCMYRCWRNFLSPTTLEMIRDMRRQLLHLLQAIGFVDDTAAAAATEPHGRYTEQAMLVRKP